VSIVVEGLREGARLLARGDPDVLRAMWLSLWVSGAATAIACALGIPLGGALALARFRGRKVVAALLNTGLGLPPVVVGLAVAMLLWRTGPLGFLHWLYTPSAVVAAQAVIAFPVVAALTFAAIEGLPPSLDRDLEALGASRGQRLFILAREARLPLLAAIMAGFGAAISEVGAVLMVGGNIRGETRVLTTAIVLETRQGRFEVAVALAFILLALTFALNLALTWVQHGRAKG